MPQKMRIGTPGSPPGLSLRAGWLIDGSGGPARPNVRLQLAGGLIRSIEGGEACTPPGAPAEADADFSGCTLIPGLIDSHVHLTMSGDPDDAFRTRLREAPFEALRGVIMENLRSHLRHGVVAVRDGGGARGNALRFARSSRVHPAPAVRIRAAGRAWHRAGRYGRLIGRPPAAGLDLAQAIHREAETPDHVKIVNSGLNSLTEFAKQTAPQFDAVELAGAVRAAGGLGRPVMVHANGVAAVQGAASAGCRSVEHGFFMGPDNLARMADQGVTWVPTAVTMQAYAGIFEQTGRSSDVARRTLDHQLEQISRARRAGVTVALGTDSGSPGVHHGAAVIAEMKLLIQAGYTIEGAVRCASLNGAALWEGREGLLAPGRPATFLVVPGAPDVLPDSLDALQAVFIDGRRQLASG
ncbi:MAG: amidohydrolase family protein [Desulfobacterales bacterium]